MRLAVIVLAIPPLRERPEDLLLMVQHFLRRAVKAGEPCPRIPPEVANLLTQYSWPGNVRELGNAIRHAVAFMPGNEITMDSLPPKIVACAAEDGASAQAAGAANGRHTFLRTFILKKGVTDDANPLTAVAK